MDRQNYSLKIPERYEKILRVSFLFSFLTLLVKEREGERGRERGERERGETYGSFTEMF